MPRGQVSAAGTFELTGLIGAQVLRVDRLPSGWIVKSIRANGKDITDGAIDFRGSEQFNVQVVLTNRISELSGTVKANGQTVTSASVVLFPEDPALWVFPSRRAHGPCGSERRVPGELAAAGRALPRAGGGLPRAGRVPGPAVPRAHEGTRDEFSLNEGENKNLDLTLIER